MSADGICVFLLSTENNYLHTDISASHMGEVIIFLRNHIP